jgi:uncharacterized protein
MNVRPVSVTRFLVGAVRLYQGARDGRVSPCRFYPSCSAFGVEALETHGAARGSWLIFRRVLRCRPGGPSGIDLVPPTVSSSSPTLSSASSLKVHNHA